MPGGFLPGIFVVMNNQVLLSTAYLAPIQYYSKFLLYDEIYIEVHENYPKQTYRNRCRIYGANGGLSLSIPVKKLDVKVKTKDILIDYDTNWRKLHWKSIESAYRSSPFFEYYQDDFMPFYEKKYKYLIDLNTDLQLMILEHLDYAVKINKTEEYKTGYEIGVDDLRDKIHPKLNINDDRFKIKSYTQVFKQKLGFIPNLSIIDLLFNEGPNTLEILKSFNSKVIS